MKYLQPLLFLFFAQIALAQTPEVISITATSHTDPKSITIDNSINTSINPNSLYKIKIIGVNSAHTSLKIIAKSKKIITPIPDVLKSILPGITESTQAFKANISDEAKNIAQVESITKRLNFIKEESDILHSKTLINTDTGESSKIYKKIDSVYASVGGDKLLDKVIADIQYLVALKTVADNVIKNQKDYDPKIIKKYSDILIMNNELTKNDYQMYFEYIDRSRTAKDFVISKVFSGSKDLVELSIILIDTYTKDTLTNETRTLFTKGGGTVELSFSSGFFFTNAFSDIPYYLKARPDESLAVLTDRQIKSDLSIGALGHLFYKVSPLFRVGPAIGIAVSPFDGKSRYLLGGSILLGKEKMLGLSVGCAWAKGKELSAVVNTDAQGSLFVPKGTSTAPTFDTLKSGWFFGLTYNLISTRK